MQVSSNFVEELKVKIPLSHIIGEIVALHKMGRDFKGLCPFHNEKTPSFHVKDEQGYYYCFGCNKHGDIISFVQETKNLDFIEAVTYLADRVGLTVEKDHSNLANDENKILYKALEDANNWFVAQLGLSKHSKIVNYLQKRKITRVEIEKFSIGYCPKEKLLSNYLIGKGYDEHILIKAGILIKKDEGEVYEWLRGRVVFPIHDSKGRIIAFAGRSINDNDMPKYRNSPETILFKKKEILFAEHLAKASNYKKEGVYIVEGYMDVIAMHAHGFTNSVASMGTALSVNHLNKIWKLTKEINICLDGDQAGQQAALNLAELAVSIITAEISLNFIKLPDNYDPDNILNLYGKDYMQSILNGKISLSEFIWQSYTAVATLNTPEQKTQLEKRIFDFTNKISDKTLKSYYNKYFKDKIWQLFYKKSKNLLVKSSNVTKSPVFNVINGEENSEINRCKYSLLAIIINYIYLLDDVDIKEEFIRIEFTAAKFNELRSLILEISEELDYNEINIVQIVKQQLSERGYHNEIDFLCGKQSLFVDNITNFDMNEANKMWDSTFEKYHIAILKQEYQDLLNDMQEESIQKAMILKNQILKLERKLLEQILD